MKDNIETIKRIGLIDGIETIQDITKHHDNRKHPTYWNDGEKWLPYKQHQHAFIIYMQHDDDISEGYFVVKWDNYDKKFVTPHLREDDWTRFTCHRWWWRKI